MAQAQRRKWSAEVTKKSDATDLEKEVFKQESPEKIAKSIKRSAERSERHKSGPFRSAVSMLNFYINHAGRNLPRAERGRLERAKDELREEFGREPRK